MTVVNAIRQRMTSVPKNIKRAALIAAVTLPTVVATQSCCPLFYGPYYCPPPPPRHNPAPPPPPRHNPAPPPPPRPHHGGHHCDIKSFEEVAKELSFMA